MPARPQVQGIFDEATNTVSYVMSDPATKVCAVVDSVLDYDPAAGRTDTISADHLIAYVNGDAAFIGDTLFMPDYGTARADFPGGDARQLYRSIRKVLSLAPETRLFLCHDYKAPGRDEYVWETTVAEERDRNIHARDGI